MVTTLTSLPDSLGQSNHIAVVTRIHGKFSSSAQLSESIPRLRQFALTAASYADCIMICMDVGEDLQNEECYRGLQKELVRSDLCHGIGVHVIPVTPWSSFTPALNAAVEHAAKLGFDLILFQSVEVIPSAADVQILKTYFEDPSTFVVGKCLDGHQFSVGRHTLSGRRCPWNTLAIWRVSLLSLLGFSLVSDGIGHDSAGVEEVVAISLLQMLKPDVKAYLIEICSPGEQGSSPTVWNTKFSDSRREEYHVAKMLSKDSRPAKQLELLGLEAGWVEHRHRSL